MENGKSGVERIAGEWKGERWEGIERPYTADDVARLRGSIRIEHTLARLGAERLWMLMKERPFVRSLGALTGNQAVQQVKAGLDAIYLSGWQVAADANLAGHMYPDQSLYPANSVPHVVRRINQALQRADQIHHSEGRNGINWFAPIVADAEAATLISEHQAAGRDVVLVSASGEEMVRPIGALLGITDVIATRMRIEDGRYSGEIEFYAAGPNKVVGMSELATVRGYDLADCYAYSDSASDLPLLEAVGHPSAVNPDRPLRRAALENSWPILEFRNPIPVGKRLRDRPAVPVAAALGVGVGAAIGLAIYARHRRSRAEV